MASLSAALDTFVICDPERSRSTTNVSIASVDDQDRERLGRLFLLTEIAPAHEANQEIIQLIQETMSRAFYGTTDRGVESAFEQALGEVNSRLQDVLRGEHHNWLPGLATFIGVLKDSFLVYTHVGSIQGFLMRGLRIVDLLHGGAVEPVVNPLKIFSSIVSGPVEASDRIVIATNSVLDYFSQEKLRRTVAMAPPSESAAYLDASLRDNPTHTAFAGLILSLTPALQHETLEAVAPGLALPPVATNQPGTSMEKLITREQSTRELLEPSFWRSMSLLTKSGFVKAEDTIRTRLLRKPARRRLNAWRGEHPAKPRSLFVTALLGLLRVLKRLFFFLFVLFVTGAGALRRLFTRSRPAAERTRPSTNGFVQTVTALGRLPRRQRAIAGGIAALVILLVAGLIIANTGEPKLTTEQQAEIAAQIRTKTEEATTVLTYGDLADARRIIQEAGALLAQLPEKRKAERELVAELRNGLQAPTEQAQRRVHPALTTHATLTNLGTAVPARVVLVGGSPVVVTIRGEVIDADTEGEPKLVGAPLEDVTVLDAVTDGNAILALAPGKLIRFVLDSGSFSTPIIELPANPTALALFQNRLYIVDQATGQVIRYPRGTNGFGIGSSWIADGTVTVESVTSLAVDGSVYLLRSDGALLELIQGQRQAFSLETIDPPLTGAALLWTDPASEALYILDPAGERLVVFTKRGGLTAQYIDPSFRDAKGFAIDEKNKRVYVVTSASLERFDLTEE